ncbi:unnamed protein product, partial [Protopolystoma xenopodis]
MSSSRSNISIMVLTAFSPEMFVYMDCKRAMRSICEFIASQCSRERKDHKRWLHSVIVAAYFCLSVWLVHRSRIILADRESLKAVLETIELGISGSKSSVSPGFALASEAGTNSAPPQPAISVSGLLSGQTGVVLKADKPMAPASRRVREAA